MSTHLVIPDVQYKEGVPNEHLHAISNMIEIVRPDKIICLGDFADMPSLSLYDVGKRSFEGRRYHKDVEAAHQGMEIMLRGLRSLQAQQRRNKSRIYSPEMYMTLGNHEHRINRVTNDDAKLQGVIGVEDLRYEEFGWKVTPYLDSIVVDGVAYSHTFYNKLSGRPWPNARTTLLREHVSCTQGHQQKLEYEIQYRGDGSPIQAIIAGACYLHDEDYKGANGNNHWRGLVLKQEVENGSYDPKFISMDSLLKRWG